MVGTFGAATCFSFYANKTITTGEGGMLVTTDERMFERVKVMRLHGINRDVWDRFTSPSAPWEYDVVAPGFKYNLPDVAAAIGLAGEIDIVFTGVRPGEKLHEELQCGGESMDKTRHPKIFIGRIAGVPSEDLAAALATLRRLASDGSSDAIRSCLASFLPDARLNGRAAVQEHAEAVAQGASPEC